MNDNHPCKNCLTYVICKDQLIRAFEHHCTLTKQFPNGINPTDHVLYEAFQESLQQKCILICAYIGGTKGLNVSNIEQRTIDALREVFLIDLVEMSHGRYIAIEERDKEVKRKRLERDSIPICE